MSWELRYKYWGFIGSQIQQYQLHLHLVEPLHNMSDISCPFAYNGHQVRDKHDTLGCQDKPYIYVILGMLI